jgi:hypothetical protein
VTEGHRRVAAWAIAVAGAALVLPVATPGEAASVVGGDALVVLDSIAVEPERPVGYDRDLFPHWLDIDGDGCNAREQVLKRDSVTLPQVDPFRCFVVAGDWVSPYDGVRTDDRSSVDIDHVVALKEAWDSGAWGWSESRRTAFANDTTDRRTLVASSAVSNRAKSDKDPSNWIPPRRAYLCPYLESWIAVKARWGLSMDRSEHGRVRNLIRSSCPGLRVAPWPALPASALVGGSSPPVTRPGRPSAVFPGAWCSPEGSIGRATNGRRYVCSPSDMRGRPYADGRARWRRL